MIQELKVLSSVSLVTLVLMSSILIFNNNDKNVYSEEVHLLEVNAHKSNEEILENIKTDVLYADENNEIFNSLVADGKRDKTLEE